VSARRSGVKNHWVASGFQTFQPCSTGTFFILTQGPHALRYYSRDNVSNTGKPEAGRDPRGPGFPVEAALVSPAPAASGVNAIFSPGALPVMASLTVDSPVPVRLEAAHGWNCPKRI